MLCTEAASAIIKGYSPELVVLPYLPEASIWDEEASAVSLFLLGSKALSFRSWFCQ